VTPYEWRSGGLGMALSLFGVVVVGIFLFQQFFERSIAPWVFVLGLIAVVIWLGGQLGQGSRWQSSPGLRVAAVVASVVMIAAGSLGAAPSNGLLVVPASIGIMRLASTLSARIWIGLAAMLLALGLIAVGSLTVTMSPIGLLAIMGGVVLGFLGGLNRRQARLAGVRERELVESTMATREEHAKAAALEAQQAVARDIHDVLAHSLGGLVIQLDAVEALLESGRTADAASRVRDARELAASGLGEARRAVEALREPRENEPVSGVEMRQSLAELVDAHRALGGSIELADSGQPHELSAEAAVALRRALQEALSNARKHAPGEAVHARLGWGQHGVVMDVRNRMAGASVTAPAALAASGGGHGLAGMSERFDALHGGSVVAQTQGDEFVVRVEVSRQAPR
jgi:signal transduction histidine kinase